MKPTIVAVSTHSRLKAAGWQCRYTGAICYRFNTQPPEGGWRHSARKRQQKHSFNTQPPEGGWLMLQYL